MGKTWSCLWLVLLFSLAATHGIILPPGLQRIMQGVHSLDSFLRAFNLGNVTLGRTLPPPPTQPDRDTGDRVINRLPDFLVPQMQRPKVENNVKKRPSLRLFKQTKMKRVKISRTRVVSFRDDTSPPLLLNEALCKPYPTVVEVPQPEHHRGFHYPLKVLLHRCAGACNTKPRVQECVATATKNISILAFVIAWTSPSDSSEQWHRAPLVIPLVNHTRCGCRCISKPTDCNLATQVFKEDNCRCECKATSRRCPLYQRWDRVRCKCVCDPPSYITCPRRFQWSPERCKCICKPSPCRKNKIRNQRNCRCYCTKFPLCPFGFKKDRRTCKCVRQI